MTKIKIDVQNHFDIVIEHCNRLQSFHATEQQLRVLRLAFDGIFNKAQTALRSRPLPWCGFISAGVVNQTKRDQCLQSAFCKLYHYHSGRNNSYLGTILNANDELRLLAEYYGLVPHPTPSRRSWTMAEGSLERDQTDKIEQDNAAAGKAFADLCDTFIQVLLYIGSGGRTSSVAGDRWRKALGIN